jgi:hypothetical protein
MVYKHLNGGVEKEGREVHRLGGRFQHCRVGYDGGDSMKDLGGGAHGVGKTEASSRMDQIGKKKAHKRCSEKWKSA